MRKQSKSVTNEFFYSSMRVGSIKPNSFDNNGKLSDGKIDINQQKKVQMEKSTMSRFINI